MAYHFANMEQAQNYIRMHTLGFRPALTDSPAAKRSRLELPSEDEDNSNDTVELHEENCAPRVNIIGSNLVRNANLSGINPGVITVSPNSMAQIAQNLSSARDGTLQEGVNHARFIPRPASFRKSVDLSLAPLFDNLQWFYNNPNTPIRDALEKYDVCLTQVIMESLKPCPWLYHMRNPNDWYSKNHLTAAGVRHVLERLGAADKDSPAYQTIFRSVQIFSGTYIFVKHATDHGSFPPELTELIKKSEELRFNPNNAEQQRCLRIQQRQQGILGRDVEPPLPQQANENVQPLQATPDLASSENANETSGVSRTATVVEPNSEAQNQASLLLQNVEASGSINQVIMHEAPPVTSTINVNSIDDVENVTGQICEEVAEYIETEKGTDQLKTGNVPVGNLPNLCESSSENDDDTSENSSSDDESDSDEDDSSLMESEVDTNPSDVKSIQEASAKKTEKETANSKEAIAGPNVTSVISANKVTDVEVWIANCTNHTLNSEHHTVTENVNELNGTAIPVDLACNKENDSVVPLMTSATEDGTVCKLGDVTEENSGVAAHKIQELTLIKQIEDELLSCPQDYIQDTPYNKPDVAKFDMHLSEIALSIDHEVFAESPVNHTSLTPAISVTDYKDSAISAKIDEIASDLQPDPFAMKVLNNIPTLIQEENNLALANPKSMQDIKPLAEMAKEIIMNDDMIKGVAKVPQDMLKLLKVESASISSKCDSNNDEDFRLYFKEADENLFENNENTDSSILLVKKENELKNSIGLELPLSIIEASNRQQIQEAVGTPPTDMKPITRDDSRPSSPYTAVNKENDSSSLAAKSPKTPLSIRRLSVLQPNVHL